MLWTRWLLALALPALLPGQAPGPSSGDTTLRKLQTALARLAKAEHRFQFLLSRARDTGSAKATAAETLLARELGAAQRLRKAAERSSPRTRGAALAALVRGAETDLGFALRRAIDDRDAAVRRHVLATIRRLGKTSVAREILTADLADKESEGNSKTRIRAARGLAALGDPEAIPALDAASKAGPCRCTRHRRPGAHVAIVTQTSVLPDFDVELG